MSRKPQNNFFAKYKSVMTPNEVLLLCAMVNSEDGNGWMKNGEIIHKTNPETNSLFYKSPSTHFPKYKNYLLEKGFIEQKRYKAVYGEEFRSSPYRTSNPWLYRINANRIEDIQKAITSFGLTYNVWTMMQFDPALCFFKKVNSVKRFNHLIEKRLIQKDKSEYLTFLTNSIQSGLRLGKGLNDIIEDLKTLNSQINENGGTNIRNGKEN